MKVGDRVLFYGISGTLIKRLPREHGDDDWVIQMDSAMTQCAQQSDIDKLFTKGDKVRVITNLGTWFGRKGTVTKNLHGGKEGYHVEVTMSDGTELVLRNDEIEEDR